ncbi:hypothetical protein BSL78_22239 [Apostichopus japonicus]|uniref:Fatty acid hydroxylase domain-containing protein n=1 Tax=Stichopus japonicus TaxID=307972 RepID=A0A2G8JYS1_STIJA|nr:hypothetical protein BSL78_22239 [Apostichopus japonicus]
MVVDCLYHTAMSFKKKQVVEAMKRLFVPMIFVIAFRNSLTWHLQRFWGASGNVWESSYKNIAARFGEENIALYGAAVAVFIVYCLNSIIFEFVDLTGKPAILLKYKVQEDQNVPVPTKKLLKCFSVVMYNLTIINVPIFLLLHPLMKARGCSAAPEDLPTFRRVFFESMVFILAEEIGFYYMHRMMHHPYLYKRIHKIHHEWTAPVAAMAVYAHPLEHVLANMLPAILGPIIMGSHYATLCMWVAFALTVSQIQHSGYHLPFLPSPEAHDFHHLKFNYNFGAIGFLDRLHGTDSLFRKMKLHHRHLFLLSLMPASQQFPIEDKKILD